MIHTVMGVLFLRQNMNLIVSTILFARKSNAVGYNSGDHQLLLENGHFIQCSGGLTITSHTLSCSFPLFDQLSISGAISSQNDDNKMLGLWSADASASHEWVKNNVGVLFGYNNEIPAAVINMNEGHFQAAGSYTNEYCYWNADVVLYVNSDCNGQIKGVTGNNVMSSFRLTYTSGLNRDLFDAVLVESLTNAVGFNLGLHQLLLENGHFIWCSGGLTLTMQTISCSFPLFDQLSITGVISVENDNNKMLGLQSVDASVTHDWVKNNVGALFGNNNQIPDAVNNMNEGDFYGKGSNTNEYCYWNADVVLFLNSDCNGFKGYNGNNVMSSFTLTYTLGVNLDLLENDGSVPIPTQLPTRLPTIAPTQRPTQLPTTAPTQRPTQLPVTQAPTQPPTYPELINISSCSEIDYTGNSGLMCTSWGDPHIIPFGRRTELPLQRASGDYLMYYSSALRIDVRMLPFTRGGRVQTNGVTGNHATAIEVEGGGNCTFKLEIYSQAQTESGVLEFLFNGINVGWNDLVVIFSACGYICSDLSEVHQGKNEFTVTFADGVMITIHNVDTMQNIYITVPHDIIEMDSGIVQEEQLCKGDARLLDCINDTTIFTHQPQDSKSGRYLLCAEIEYPVIEPSECSPNAAFIAQEVCADCDAPCLIPSLVEGCKFDVCYIPGLEDAWNSPSRDENQAWIDAKEFAEDVCGEI